MTDDFTKISKQFNDIANKMEASNGKMLKNARAIATQKMNKVLDASKNEVPVDTSDLWQSGRLEQEPDGVAVIYHSEHGGFNYAMKQHEDLSISHPNGGKAKYLEDPFNQIVGDNIGEIFKDILKGVFK